MCRVRQPGIALVCFLTLGRFGLGSLFAQPRHGDGLSTSSPRSATSRTIVSASKLSGISPFWHPIGCAVGACLAGRDRRSLRPSRRDLGQSPRSPSRRGRSSRSACTSCTRNTATAGLTRLQTGGARWMQIEALWEKGDFTRIADTACARAAGALGCRALAVAEGTRRSGPRLAATARPPDRSAAELGADALGAAVEHLRRNLVEARTTAREAARGPRQACSFQQGDATSPGGLADQSVPRPRRHHLRRHVRAQALRGRPRRWSGSRSRAAASSWATGFRATRPWWRRS